jgi:hypothetical protein
MASTTLTGFLLGRYWLYRRTDLTPAPSPNYGEGN